MIWNVADMLSGPLKPHEYGLVTLPMMVVKRFHDCLLPYGRPFKIPILFRSSEAEFISEKGLINEICYDMI